MACLVESLPDSNPIWPVLHSEDAASRAVRQPRMPSGFTRHVPKPFGSGRPASRLARERNRSPSHITLPAPTLMGQGLSGAKFLHTIWRDNRALFHFTALDSN